MSTASVRAGQLTLGEDKQHPWLVVNTDTHPFTGEQYIAVATSTKEYDDSLALSEPIRMVGGVPQESYVSPWEVHSPRSEEFVAWQSHVTYSFVEQVIDQLRTYLRHGAVASSAPGRIVRSILISSYGIRGAFALPSRSKWTIRWSASNSTSL